MTKRRPAYRTVTKQVTKYRDEPRSFTYDATEHVSNDSSELLDAFADREIGRLRRDLRERLDTRYRQQHCTRAAYDREQAAVCTYLDAAGAPAGAHATLRATFGDDEPLLAPLLAR